MCFFLMLYGLKNVPEPKLMSWNCFFCPTGSQQPFGFSTSRICEHDCDYPQSSSCVQRCIKHRFKTEKCFYNGWLQLPPCRGGIGLLKCEQFALVCTLMVINACRCQSDHTALKPGHASLTPVSVPAFVYMRKQKRAPQRWSVNHSTVLSFHSQMHTIVHN